MTPLAPSRRSHRAAAVLRPRYGALLAARAFSVLGLLLVVACAGEPGTDAGASDPRVDAIFAQWDRSDSPGCALGVIRDGEFVYRRGYGMANLEHGVPNGSQSVFRVASVSKQFVGMLVLLLEEEGLLSREDDIRRWIPEMPDFGETIQVSHLLHHTSGLRDYLVLMALAGYRDEDYYTAPELLAMLTRQRELNFAPGEDHLYSNTGYFLLGQIIERATGQTLDEAAQERMFGPLGMTSTHFHDDPTRVVEHRASGYAPGDDGWVISMTTLPIVGDGAVFTSVDDLLHWDRNFYENRLGQGDPAIVARWTDSGLLANGEPTGYGAGITDREYRGARLVSHGGAFVGYRADMLRFPEHRFSVAVLCNTADVWPTGLALQVADVFLEDVLTPAPDATTEDDDTDATADEAPAERYLLPVADLRGYAGRYVSPELQTTYVLGVADGHLVSEIPGRSRTALEPEGEDRFFAAETSVTLRFARNSRGEVSGFLLDAGRVRNLWFERIE